MYHPSHLYTWAPSLILSRYHFDGLYSTEQRGLPSWWVGTSVVSLEGEPWDQKPVFRRGKGPSGHSLPGVLNSERHFLFLTVMGVLAPGIDGSTCWEEHILSTLGVTSFGSTCSVNLRRGPPQWCPIHSPPWSCRPCSCSLLWWVAVISVGSVCLVPDFTDVAIPKEAYALDSA